MEGGRGGGSSGFRVLGFGASVLSGSRLGFKGHVSVPVILHCYG